MDTISVYSILYVSNKSIFITWYSILCHANKMIQLYNIILIISTITILNRPWKITKDLHKMTVQK